MLLHAHITEASEKSGRSMNAEIVHRLEQSFAKHSDDQQTQMYLALRWLLLTRTWESEVHIKRFVATDPTLSAKERADTLAYSEKVLQALIKRIADIEIDPLMREFGPPLFLPSSDLAEDLDDLRKAEGRLKERASILQFRKKGS